MATRRYRVMLGERTFDVEVSRESGEVNVTLDGRTIGAELLPPNPSGVGLLRLGERLVEVVARPAAGRVSLSVEGIALEVQVEDERAARLARFGGAAARQAGKQVVAAPMPGLVVRVNVQPGQAVKRGESLVVLQAMKMENELGSPRDGTVSAVAVEAGQAVEHGQVLVELE